MWATVYMLLRGLKETEKDQNGEMGVEKGGGFGYN